jgi:hypothetical protein
VNFPTPIPLSTLAWFAGGVAALTLVAYVLKIRRRRFEVPFSMLWQRVLEQRDANALWKQLKRLLSLLLMLVILGLMLFAALDPTQGGMPREARTVVILIDTSASMKASDESARDAAAVEVGDEAPPVPAKVTPASRIEIAKKKAIEVIDSMGGSDVAMVMRLDGQATPLSRFETDAAMLRRTVTEIEASDTPADLHRALGAAADALRGRQNPLIVLISDGAFSEAQLAAVTWGVDASAAETADAEADPAAAAPAPAPPVDDEVAARRKVYEHRNLAAVDLSGIDVRYVPVGTRADNVGIIAFNVRRYVANKAAYEVFIEIENFGTTPARRQLALYSGESAIDVQPIALEPGEKLRRLFPNLSGGADHRLRASLRPVEGEGGSDPFALDDEAFALLPERKRQKVLLVTDDNLYLEGAMLVYDNIEVFKVTRAEYDAGADDMLAEVHVVVFDDHTPTEVPPPPVHAIYFHPTGDGSPIPIARTAPRPPRITDIAEGHPVLRWVTLTDVNFDATQVFAPRRAEGEIALAHSVRDVVIAAKREGGRKILAVGFSLGATDLMLRVAFPLLLVNALDWFAGDDADLVTTYVTGRRLRVPLDGVVGVAEAEVVGPDGEVSRAPVVDGTAQFYGSQIGFHEIRAFAPTERGVERDRDIAPLAVREIAANLANPDESRIEPAAALLLGGKNLERPPEFQRTVQKSFWRWILLLVLFVLGVEWITYHRRITV